MNLNIRLQTTPPSLSANNSDILVICDRCHNFEGRVIATLYVLEFDQTWSLCEACTDEFRPILTRV
jgi:hypothetical protein